jgi:hypothetical protein
MDCHKFVDCWDGRVREKYCPDNQVFSDLPGGFCDYLEYVDCGNRPLLQHNNDTSSTTTTAQPPSSSTLRSSTSAKWLLVRKVHHRRQH